jgi:uncharacterized protein (TIRG00374 family)
MNWKSVGKWILALVLFALVFILGDVRELLHLRVAWIFALGILFSTFTFILLHALRWKKIVDAISEKRGTSFFPYYQWMIHSYTLSYVMPRDLSLLSVRTYYLKQYQNLSLSASLFSVTLDRLLDFVIFFAVVIPSFLFIIKILSPVPSLILIGISIGALLLIIRWKREDTFRSLIHVYQKILALPFIKNLMKMEKSETEVDYSIGRDTFFTVSTWTVGAYLLLVLRFFFTGMALNVNVSLLQSLFILPVIQVSGLINITPGGLGVLELGSWGALLLIDVPKDQILRFVLGQRVLLTAVMLLLILSNHLLFLLKGRQLQRSRKVKAIRGKTSS